MKRVWRHVARAPLVLYRWHLGWLLGHRFVMLRHVGRVSGATRETVLEVVRYQPTSHEVVVVSGFGTRADWYRNLRANGDAHVVVGRDRYRALVRVLHEDEACEVLAGYERQNRLIAGMVRAVLSSPLGWRYDGTPESRRRAVRQLPLVALRPDAG